MRKTINRYANLQTLIRKGFTQATGVKVYENEQFVYGFANKEAIPTGSEWLFYYSADY